MRYYYRSPEAPAGPHADRFDSGPLGYPVWYSVNSDGRIGCRASTGGWGSTDQFVFEQELIDVGYLRVAEYGQTYDIDYAMDAGL